MGAVGVGGFGAGLGFTHLVCQLGDTHGPPGQRHLIEHADGHLDGFH